MESTPEIIQAADAALDKLKCPFCGSKLVLHHDPGMVMKEHKGRDWQVFCLSYVCDARFPRAEQPDKAVGFVARIQRREKS